MTQRTVPIPPYTTVFQLENNYEVAIPVKGKAKGRTVTFDGDDLKIYNRNLEYLRDPKFKQAYHRGMQSGHHIQREQGSDTDIMLHCRVHTVLWAAQMAAKLEGDFVECGVNTGILSLAICEYVNFNALDKDFYLFDTYAGIPGSHVSARDNGELVQMHNDKYYSDCYEVAKANFEPFPRAKLVKGTVPETLSRVEIDKVAYLSLDLNISAPELAALEHFWDKMVPGGVIVLDDYGWMGYEEQNRLEGAFIRSRGHEVMTLPTGQGLVIKQG